MMNLFFYMALSGYAHFKHDGVMYTTGDYIELLDGLSSVRTRNPFHTLDRLMRQNPDVDRIYVVNKNKPPYVYKKNGSIEHVCK